MRLVAGKDGRLRVVAKARTETKRRGQMNRTEAAYEDAILRPAYLAGDIVWYRYEAVTLVLAENVRYTPDFMVQRADGSLEIHECKGFMRDDARVKLEMAAELYPFRVILARIEKKVWSITGV